MRRESKARTALALVVTVAVVCGAGRASAQTSSEPAREAPGPARFAPVTDWLERAAEAYQREIAGKLSVPREAAAAGDTSAAARGAAWLGATLRAATDAALRYIDFWIGRAFELAGLPRLDDGAARDARDFVEARRKADEAWRAAQENRLETAEANAAAASRLPDAEAAKEKRKEELARKKQELDKQIEEGLRKLEEFEKASKAKKEEEERKTLEQKRKSEEDAARRADEEERRLAEEKRKKDADAARQAEEERKAAEAKRLADLRAEEARKAAAKEAERKAQEEQKRAAEAKRLADARAEAERKAADERMAAEEKRLSEERAAAERKAADAARKAEEDRKTAAAEADRSRAGAIARADVTAPASRRQEAPPPKDQEKAAPVPIPSESEKSEPPPARVAEQSGARAEVPAQASTVPKKARTTPRAKAKLARLSHSGGPRQCRPGKSGKRHYTVRRGDTLWDIARRHLRKGERYVSLYRANRRQIRDPDRIYPCQRLRLPKKHA